MNAHGRTVDKTYLSINQAEERGFLHRDYIAHCLRWSHACKVLSKGKLYQSARILDIGCGRELPMAKMLYSSRLIPSMYYGVDAGPINDEDAAKVAAGKFPHKLWEQCNFLELTKEDVALRMPPRLPNFVTCFEILEHVEPKMMMDMLEHVRELTTDDAKFLISTPCWNRTDCADNHVNEMLYEALGAAFERHGFVVEHVYGTFASIRDYEHLLPRHPGGNEPWSGELLGDVFDMLREYYDTNFLSCVFAPLFPAQSRNCLWELSKANPKRFSGGKYPMIDTIQRPWSSSTKWEDMKL